MSKVVKINYAEGYEAEDTLVRGLLVSIDGEEHNEYREEFSKQHKDVTFYVVNYKLKQFIESKGLFPIIDDKSEEDGTCHNLRTENCFWRYIKNQELDSVINEWKSLYY